MQGLEASGESWGWTGGQLSAQFREFYAKLTQRSPTAPICPEQNLSSSRALRRPARTRLDLSFVICERTVFLTSGAAAGIRTGIEHRHASRSRDALKSQVVERVRSTRASRAYTTTSSQDGGPVGPHRHHEVVRGVRGRHGHGRRALPLRPARRAQD